VFDSSESPVLPTMASLTGADPQPSAADPLSQDPTGAGCGSPPTTPCLAYLVDRETLLRVGDSKAIATDVEALRRVRSERVLSLLGTGSTDKECFTALSCPHPMNLGVRLAEWRFLGWEEVCRILTEVAIALGDTHQVGLLAGVIEPYHIQIHPQGAVGLAVLGPELSIKLRDAATVRCLPPELRNGPATVATDLYGLGLLGVELLTGKLPTTEQIDAVNSAESMAQMLFSLACREFDLPRAMVETLRVLTSKDPMARPTSAAAVIDHLRHQSRTQLAHARQLVLGEEPETDEPPMPPMDVSEMLGRVPPPPASSSLSEGQRTAQGSSQKPRSAPVRLYINIFLIAFIIFCLASAASMFRSERMAPVRRLLLQGDVR